MKQYFVISRESCHLCNGGKTALTPLWSKFTAFMNRWERRYNEKYFYSGTGQFDKKVAVQDAWWNKHGYPDGWTTWPPKDQQCDNCRGFGYIQENVDFNEALAATLTLKLSAS